MSSRRRYACFTLVTSALVHVRCPRFPQCPFNFLIVSFFFVRSLVLQPNTHWAWHSASWCFVSVNIVCSEVQRYLVLAVRNVHRGSTSPICLSSLPSRPLKKMEKGEKGSKQQSPFLAPKILAERSQRLPRQESLNANYLLVPSLCCRLCFSYKSFGGASNNLYLFF